MKRKLLFVAVAALSCAGLYAQVAVQNLQWDAEVSVFMEKGNRGRAQQGLETYGDYIFSLEDGGHVNVYDFNTAASDPIGGFELASSRPDNHANNAEFGIEKKRGASFPLLYVTNGKVGSEIEWTCFVESISFKRGVWSSELAQTITLDGCKGWKEKGYTEIFGAPSWLIDRERKEMWVFSAIKRTTFKYTAKMTENKYVATKFRIPKLSEGKEVTLGVEDILDQKTFPYDVWFTQAGCVKDGKIYYCYGIGKLDWNRPSVIRVYDTDSGRIAASYNLQDEVVYEMEDMFIRDGYIYVNTNCALNPPIYKVSLPKNHFGEEIPRAWLSHRGVHLGYTLAGENSLEAIDMARRAGFKYIETDCRWTSDSVMVIMHDRALNRTCTRADGSPLDAADKINVDELTFEQLRRDFRLKADRPEFRTQVPTLEEYLLRCKEQGFHTVFIEPKIKDSTGRFYTDIVRIADKTVSRQGYLIVSNNFANEVIRATMPKERGLGLMGILYQTTYEKMDALGNCIFALSPTRFDDKQFAENFVRARSEGKTIETNAGLRSQSPQVNFDGYMKIRKYGPNIEVIASDLCAPDYRGQGEVLAEFKTSHIADLAGKFAGIGKQEFCGVYFDLKYSGTATVTVGPDSFVLPAGNGKTACYARMIYDAEPNFSIAPGPGFALNECKVRIVKF